MDPADIEQLISERTKALVVMHYGGYPARVAEARALADRHGLYLIEDAAHSPIVPTPDGVLGTIGDIGCFSFFATKNLTTGEGGMILARDAELLARARSLRSHCIDGSSRNRTASGSAGYDVARSASTTGPPKSPPPSARYNSASSTTTGPGAVSWSPSTTAV